MASVFGHLQKARNPLPEYESMVDVNVANTLKGFCSKEVFKSGCSRPWGRGGK